MQTCENYWKDGGSSKNQTLIYVSPNIFPSEFIKKSIELVQGQPQTIYKIPFVNNEELGVDWIDIDNIIDRVIIGPTENSHVLYEAFLEIMADAGIRNPKVKITVSDIPLR